MNRQDFDKWVENRALPYAKQEWVLAPDEHIKTGSKTESKIFVSMDDFKNGADAAYNLLSKEIGEKDELNKKEIEYWMNNCESKKQEIERLKGLIKKGFDFSICDLPDDEQKELWQQFKKDNQL